MEEDDVRQAKPMNLTILGPGAVGKTSLIFRFLTDQFLEDVYQPTIEDKYHRDLEVDGKAITVDILDTAGQEEMEAMQEHWIKQSDAIMLVFSVDSKNSFHYLEKLKDTIMINKDLDDDNFTSFPLIISGNKCDLEKKRREVSRAQLENRSSEWGCRVFETSAKESTNVKECFEELVRVYWEKEAEAKANSQSQPTGNTGGSCCHIL